MLRVFAYNHYVTFSFDNFALIANFLNGWFNFHCVTRFLSYFERQVILPLVRS